MKTISVDFETRSTVDLRKTGVYPYAEDPSTDVWCMAWAKDDEDVQLWVPGDPVPPAIVAASLHGDVVFRAWNAQFERVIWEAIMVPRYGFPSLDAERWHDTQAEAAMLGLPLSLGKAGKVLKAEHQKDGDGRRLMLQMAKPRRPRKDEDPDAVLWWDDTDRCQRLYAYCMDDVESERSIAQKLQPLVGGMGKEREVYLLDQTINDRGVPLDIPLIKAAQRIADEGVERACIELDELTDGVVTAPTQIANMKAWLDDNGMSVSSLNKNAIRDMLAGDALTPEARKLLEIRQDVGKSSVAKLEAMLAYAGSNGRAQGMLQYHGAATGRWSGRGPQPQNMTRPSEYEHAEDCPKKPCECGGVERFIPHIMLGDYDGLAALAPPVTAVSDVLRSCFRASDGCTFLGGDFSSIEMHVLAWVAGQENSATYEEMAGDIFGLDPASITKDMMERMVGKVAILACGYQMGSDKFIFTVKEWTGLDILEPDICEGCAFRVEKGWEAAMRKTHSGCTGDLAVKAYRAKHDMVEQHWHQMESAAMGAVQSPGEVYAVWQGDLYAPHQTPPAQATKFLKAGPFLWMQLPSGRRLAYALPRITMRTLPPPYEHIEKPSLTVAGQIGYSWGRRGLYGGLLTENEVQAAARDIMVASMLRLEKVGYPIVLTVHDEILCEVPQGFGNVTDFENIMAVTPSWAKGCHVAVEAWRGERYRK